MGVFTYLLHGLSTAPALCLAVTFTEHIEGIDSLMLSIPLYSIVLLIITGQSLVDIPESLVSYHCLTPVCWVVSITHLTLGGWVVLIELFHDS